MSFTKASLKNAPIVFSISVFALIFLFNIIGRHLPSFAEFCCFVILTIIVTSCFALLFRFPIISSNLNDVRYCASYLIACMFTSLLLAIYSPSSVQSGIQSFIMHLLSSLALLISILASSLLPIIICYEKCTLSWRDLFRGLKLVMTVSEKVINHVLGKLAFCFIFLMPASIIISYLLVEAYLLTGARINNISFSTLVLSVLYFVVAIAVSVEIWHKLSKSFLSFVLFISIYYLYILSTSITSSNQKLEYSPNTFYTAIAVLGLLFILVSIVASAKCRNEVATSA